MSPNVSGISWGVDLYRVMVFPLDSNGAFLTTPDGSTYEGLQFEGSRVFEITPAEARPVDNYGDGRLRDTIYLPPNTSTRGELRVGYEHHGINAALTGVEQFFVGEKSFLPMSTDQQGNEPIVALILSQMAHDGSKLKRWRNYIVPRAQCIPLPSSFNENATEMRYQITMNPSTVTLWNLPLTMVDHGCLESAYQSVMSQDRLNSIMWEGDGVYSDVITLPANKPALNIADKMTVHNLATGAAVTAGITKATTSVTFAAPPTDPMLVLYEY